MDIKALFARAAELNAQMEALEKSREASADKKFTAEQMAAYKAALSELEQVNDSIDTAQRADKVKARTAQPAGAQAPGISMIHPTAEEAPYSFGELLQDIAGATRTQFRQEAPRLVNHQKRNMEIVRNQFRMATGLNEALPSQGGYLVGTEFASGMIERLYENSALASRCARTPIGPGANTLKINGVDETSRANGSRFGGVQGYWVAEAATITGSKPKFRQVELNLKKLAALFYATGELLQDATALGAVAERCVIGELDFMLQDAILNGNGAGKPYGILASPALVTITKETGQAADTIVFQNISKMWAALWSRSRPNAVWLINQEIEPQLDLLAIPVGTGGMPAYMPPGGLSESPYGTLKGRPVIPIEQAAALGDAGDISLVDLSQYQLIDKGGVQAASSIHVQFLADEEVFRFIYRVDGQPLWHSPLTPYKGAQTQSAFVTLGARA